MKLTTRRRPDRRLTSRRCDKAVSVESLRPMDFSDCSTETVDRGQASVVTCNKSNLNTAALIRRLARLSPRWTAGRELPKQFRFGLTITSNPVRG